uniref:(northern house mosquito) hypothetical protein n=1 Tax=Culex pipiens TaxID=7175 RepID=A0A8D8NA72_CULPI
MYCRVVWCVDLLQRRFRCTAMCSDKPYHLLLLGECVQKRATRRLLLALFLPSFPPSLSVSISASIVIVIRDEDAPAADDDDDDAAAIDVFRPLPAPASFPSNRTNKDDDHNNYYYYNH